MAESSHLSSTKKVQIDIFFRVGRNRTLFSNEKTNTTPTRDKSTFKYNILKGYLFVVGAADGHAWGVNGLGRCDIH
jgi:uncharacterized protein (DUF3084 family)